VTVAPTAGTSRQTALAQSLAEGSPGAALLPIERAKRGLGSWQDAHNTVAACGRDLIADTNSSLYFGAPAVAFALHTAAGGSDRYTGALRTLDVRISALTLRRVGKAHARINRGDRPRASEFDLFYGLTGLGVYLLHRDSDSRALHEVLRYLVRLTRPLPNDPDQLPGWWAPVGPSGRPSPEFAGGHANLGIAHGIAGPLALLSLATRRGVIVRGQITAIEQLCDWLDRQRQDGGGGPWWPQWITLAEHRTASMAQTGPSRPSWCYGTPGIARAQQLAGLALGDAVRRRMAEDAFVACVADPSQLALVRDAGLCHGAAGLLHVAHRVAADSEDGRLTVHLPGLRALLTTQEHPHEEGLLDGTTGLELAQSTADTSTFTAASWDACLLAG